LRRRQPELRPPPGRAPGFPVPVLVSLPELKFQQYTAPSRNDEYLLHQTLQRAWSVGGADPTALDTFHARIQAYMLKAVREGKPHGSCINPNPAYEAAVARLVSALLERPEINPFSRTPCPSSDGSPDSAC